MPQGPGCFKDPGFPLVYPQLWKQFVEISLK
jgi:hypothetical protein